MIYHNASHRRSWALWASLALAVLALVIPLWPLSVAAIIVAALGGVWPLAILLGILFDLLYGRPPGGWLHALAFPMTALALVASFIRQFVKRYLRRERQEFL